jgi:hypothetical protein
LDLGGLRATMIKLASSASSPPVISEKEQAVFILENNIASMNEQLEKTLARVQKLKGDITSLLHTGAKKNALILLRQKNRLEAYWEKVQGQKFLLED